ncbi:MAG TPA: Gfo/Idh/MocA family oxidoreductase [Phycisphaerae bacterium]|jgi:predicted dehydrogenase|nr:Gfo/Idh/MocA family oxidoreductase [Phycisphaerae bacterium]HOJ53407.1 Gfo/Idh/MocA family oxidoreductase [Phycisphaerae bacterium]HOL25469.1 Gfo/Idh/MocA family oxidoreductase [Phycisphaerae bacterium]HPP19854.1 Gfo/Idh/MocA family oxidoreductase [Phycisphaerae bacterium]HPU31220.1 Gfo/Idh/MocA family oxidoreductase [Phycisphaerae bacterium]
MIRVGLIGAGFIGRNHFNQYEKLGARARVVALCDLEPDRRAGDWSKVGGNVADTQGTKRDLGNIRQYADWKELLADPEVDMVDLCIPTYLHAEMAIAALKAGKHVLCEKPMALTVEDCDRMLEAARDAKGKFMVAQVIRFWPECVYLRNCITDQRYGALKALHLRRQASTPDYSWRSWILDPRNSGGALLDLHVHDVDWAIQLVGMPQAITAQGYQRTGGGIDRVTALWHCGPDRVVQLEGYWDMPAGFGFNMGFTAVFEKAAIVFDLASGKPLTVFRNGAAPETPKIEGEDGYYAEIEYFLSCVEKNENPQISTPQESRNAVAVALAEKQSILTGQTVRL